MSGQPHPMRPLVGVQKARNAGRASNLIQTQYRQERFSVYPIVTVIEQLKPFSRFVTHTLWNSKITSI